MKLLKSTSIIITAVMLSACDSFLNEQPQTSVSSEGVYNSVSSANAVLAGCYAKLQDYNAYAYNYFHLTNVTSGLGVSLKANDSGLTSMNILPSDNNVSNTYKALYKTIAVTNDIIAGMRGTQIEDTTAVKKIEGEAYFIRAVSYFNLVRLFGKLSIVTEPVANYEQAHSPRSEVSDVYDNVIIPDLEKAWNLLPDASDQSVGYPNKYAAKALLAKVYVTLAGNQTAAETDYWQMAYDNAKAVYDAGAYSLVHPYSNVFGAVHKNNPESIFEIQFASGVNEGRLTESAYPVGYPVMDKIPTQGKQWGKVRPTQYMYDMFDDDDPRLDVSFVHTSYTNIYTKQNTILYPTKKAEGSAAKLVYKAGDSEYAAWNKYSDPSMTAQGSSANFVYFRYADLLLLLAESANELDAVRVDAPKYLNMVLDRAADANGNRTRDEGEVSPLAVTAEETANADAFRERVVKERLLELTGECDSWFTVRRRGEPALKKIMEAHNKTVKDWYASQGIKLSSVKFVYTYDVTDDNVKKNMLMPFPTDEITANSTITSEDQNYGY